MTHTRLRSPTTTSPEALRSPSRRSRPRRAPGGPPPRWRADDYEEGRGDEDQRGEEVRPRARRVTSHDDRGGVVTEGHGNHRADDDDRRQVPEPRGDPDEASITEALDEVGDETPGGGVAN